MDDAIRLFTELPTSFFAMSAEPLYFGMSAERFAAGPLRVVPFFATLCLGAGVVLGVVRRQWQLLLFLISVGLSQFFVAIAGALGKHFRGEDPLPYLLFFLGLQLVLLAFLVYRSKGARAAAVMLALFCASYALLAYLFAAMALTGDGL